MADTPLYKTNYMGFWVRVYSNRVDFKAGAGQESVPINQIASIKLGMVGYMQVVIETTGGKKYKIPCIKKKELREAIYKAQSSPSQPSAGVADELVKLADLRNKGVISAADFDKQKNQLLNQ